MAQCSELSRLNLSVRKDIKVTNFSRSDRPSSVTLEYDGTEPFFNVQVYPKGRSADHGDYVSVMISRCRFYPRFFPGVVYGSLGWTISVVDVEGREWFHGYFGGDDFLSLVWAEDFFGDHEFGLDAFVKRSQLLNDPDLLLPDDVLTVRCEAFYERHTGDAALLTTGVEINAFLVKGFMVQGAQPNGSGTPSGPPDQDQSQSGPRLISEDELTASVSQIESPKPLVAYEDKHWQKSISMMTESFDELSECFVSYAKLQMLDVVKEQNPKSRGGGEGSNSQQDRDFSQDVEMAAAVFISLHENADVAAKEEDSSKSDTKWWDEPDGVAIVTHQVVRALALHKHLQLRFGNCKDWYKEAAEKMKVVRDFCSGKSPDSYSLEDEIRELFFLYNEILESFGDGECLESKGDYLLLHVSRFLAVFLNTLRVMALRLYWPICVLQGNATVPDTNATQKTGDNETEQNEDTVHKLSTNDQIPVSKTENINEDTVHKLSTNDQIPVSETGKINKDTVHKLSTNDQEPVSETEKINEESDPGSSSGWTIGEKWNFTIETADGKQLDIPFQDGQRTLGSLIRAASPVFDRMLDTPMLEKAQKRVKLDDIDYSTLCHFTTYLQTGEVKTETVDESSLLYALAHKYQVQALVLDCVKRICELMSHLDADEVGDFSKFFQDDTLMSLVEAWWFRPRATMAVMGLQELNVTPLSRDSTWSQSIAEVPIVEKATEAIAPKEDYDFYN